jgi:hypothetical protein
LPNPSDGGYARLCANYIAGIIELATAKASARWPQRPSNIITGLRTFVDTTQKEDNIVILDKVIALLIEFVCSKPAADLIGQCKAIGMRQQPYEDILGGDKLLPDFDSGYRFIFLTNDDVNATMDILEKEKGVLQAGVQIVYPPTTSEDLIAKHYSQVQRAASERFGKATPLTSPEGAEILNWADFGTLFYTHRYAPGRWKSITFRAGNRKLWAKPTQ